MHIISHRGYRNRWPENTIGAFADAVAFSQTNKLIRGLELDIQLTSDGEIVVLHNPSLWVAHNEEWVIARTPYEKIAQYADDCSDVRGRVCPLLEDVLKFVSHQLVIYCEIKAYDYDYDVLVDGLVRLMDDYGPGDMVIHSFNPQMLKMVIEAFSGTGRQFGFLMSSPEMFDIARELSADLDYIHPQFELFLNHVSEISAMGRRLNVWTPNRERDIVRLVESDKDQIIEGIITDDVSLVRHI